MTTPEFENPINVRIHAAIPPKQRCKTIAQYLHTMGIESWRLRAVPQKKQTEILCFVLEGNGGALIAEVSSPQERELFAAIRAALGVNLVERNWNADSHALLFGAHLANFYHSSSVTMTHSLTEMLENPRLKAKVWQDLKNSFLFKKN
jgi:hypothetical protein